MPPRSRRCSQIPRTTPSLVMNVPTALASAQAAAKSVAAVAQAHRNSSIRPKPDLRRVGREQRCGHADLRSRRHSQLRDRIRCGPRLHASGALPGSARSVDGDAAEPAAGFQAGRRRRPRGHRGRGAATAAPGSIRSRSRACSRPMPFRSRPRCSPADADEAAAAARPAAGGGIDRRGENPLAGHRSQIGGRRRPAQPHQRTRRARGGHRYPRARQGGKA